MKCAKLFIKLSAGFLRIDEGYKLMMDEMYETGRLIAKFGYETRVCLFGMYDS